MPRARLSLQPGGEFLIHMTPMADGHEVDDPRLAVDRIDDSEPSDSKLPQAGQFPHKGFATLRVDCDGSNSRFDGTLQFGMKRADRISDMRRDIGTEGRHTVRRFFAGVTGSPNTSSNERPFLPAR